MAAADPRQIRCLLEELGGTGGLPVVVQEQAEQEIGIGRIGAAGCPFRQRLQVLILGQVRGTINIAKPETAAAQIVGASNRPFEGGAGLIVVVRRDQRSRIATASSG